MGSNTTQLGDNVSKSDLEGLFAKLLRIHGLDYGWERDYRFAAHHVGLGLGIKARLKNAGLRDWRFDFALPDALTAVELHGGEWVGGRHVTGSGFSGDREKMNAALLLGWRVLEFPGKILKQDPVGCINKVIALLELVGDESDLALAKEHHDLQL